MWTASPTAMAMPSADHVMAFSHLGQEGSSTGSQDVRWSCMFNLHRAYFTRVELDHPVRKSEDSAASCGFDSRVSKLLVHPMSLRYSDNIGAAHIKSRVSNMRCCLRAAFY